MVLTVCCNRLSICKAAGDHSSGGAATREKGPATYVACTRDLHSNVEFSYVSYGISHAAFSPVTFVHYSSVAVGLNYCTHHLKPWDQKMLERSPPPHKPHGFWSIPCTYSSMYIHMYTITHCSVTTIVAHSYTWYSRIVLEFVGVVMSRSLILHRSSS